MVLQAHLLHEGLLLLQHDAAQREEGGVTQLQPHGARAAASCSSTSRSSSWCGRSCRAAAASKCLACLQELLLLQLTSLLSRLL
jgi:hypothetical protein